MLGVRVVGKGDWGFWNVVRIWRVLVEKVEFWRFFEVLRVRGNLNMCAVKGFFLFGRFACFYFKFEVWYLFDGFFFIAFTF